MTMAPGVSGLGTSTSGSPASGVDNFSTEEQVDASANGQGQNNNQYIIDGLDVTSGIRQGVLNLTPQPDSIQETSVQVNTFSVEHSRAAGLQTIFTTKSGTDRFMGPLPTVSTIRECFANQHFVSSSDEPYKPFHSNNMDFSVGGPIIPHHNSFFYFAVEPCVHLQAPADRSLSPIRVHRLRTSKLSRTPWDHTVLSTYLPSGVGGVTVQQTRVRTSSVPTPEGAEPPRTKWRALPLCP